jgi:hypothetical protein
VQVTDEVPDLAVLVDPLVVEVRAEVNESGIRVGEEMPDDDED